MYVASLLLLLVPADRLPKFLPPLAIVINSLASLSFLALALQHSLVEFVTNRMFLLIGCIVGLMQQNSLGQTILSLHNSSNFLFHRILVVGHDGHVASQAPVKLVEGCLAFGVPKELLPVRRTFLESVHLGWDFEASLLSLRLIALWLLRGCRFGLVLVWDFVVHVDTM